MATSKGRTALTLLAFAAAGCVVSAAQQPKVTNAAFSVSTGTLQQTVAAARSPQWIGYTFAPSHAVRSNWDENVVHLEGYNPQDHIVDPAAPVPPAMILMRVEASHVTRVRVEQVEHEVDGGGLPFVWIANVSPAESVRTLKDLVVASAEQEARDTAATSPDKSSRDKQRDYRRLQDGALTALALMSGEEATAALRSLSEPPNRTNVRERAAFWLANEPGAVGFLAIKDLLRTETDSSLREKLVFDLTLVKGDSKKAALEELLTLAKSDAAEGVRRQAQFWLAEMEARNPTGDARVAQVLSKQAEDDDNAALRKSAVFALSRLPDSEGVPKLIQLASTTKDITTRREAIQWLGKKKDPQALAYLETLVK